MKRTTLSNHIEAFKSEALMLLRFQLALDRILKFENIHSISRSDFVDHLMALKALENDLVIRICKFDDDTKGVHSFKKVIKELPANRTDKKIIETKIKEFSDFIEPIRNIRRHTQLAHLKIGVKDNDYTVRYELVPAIRMIVEIIDLLNDKKIEYTWKDGSLEKFNLRHEVLKELS